MKKQKSKKSKASKTLKAATRKKETKSKAGRPSDVFQLQAGKEVWPLEKDILFRPDRFKYVRKLIQPDGCVFCRSSEEELSFETLCIYKSKFSMVVLNKFPYNSGHVLVLPQRHCGDILKLEQSEFNDLQNLMRKSVEAIQTVYSPAGFNVGLNLGAVAGAGIPDHIHYHIVPRWAGDLNFFPLIAETKVVIENLDVTYDRLMGYFKSNGI